MRSGLECEAKRRWPGTISGTEMLLSENRRGVPGETIFAGAGAQCRCPTR
jgi:hypothetical protein